MSENEIKIKTSEVEQVFRMLNVLIECNDQPFRGHARKLVFDLQPEKRFLDAAPASDIEAIWGKEISLGPKIPPPDSYADQHRDLLQKICSDLPEKTSRLSKIIESKKDT